MLRELRKRFVFIVMACMFCIFFLLLFAINLFNFANQQQKISRTMQTLVENNGELPLERIPHDSVRPEEPDRSRQDAEAPFMVCIAACTWMKGMELSGFLPTALRRFRHRMPLPIQKKF